MTSLQLLTTPVLTLAGMPMSPGDLAGFVTGIVCVWLTARGNIWNFPAGIVNSVILGMVFFQQRLFADAGLQLVFIGFSLWGWQLWLSGRQTREDAPVSRSPRREQLLLLAAAAALSVLLWALLLWLKGSAPKLDALITALSLCAQYQLNRRRLESWWWWIAVDLISIPLFWSRGLPLIAGLYVVFLLLCVHGWRTWKPRVSA